MTVSVFPTVLVGLGLGNGLRLDRPVTLTWIDTSASDLTYRTLNPDAHWVAVAPVDRLQVQIWDVAFGVRGLAIAILRLPPPRRPNLFLPRGHCDMTMIAAAWQSQARAGDYVRTAVAADLDQVHSPAM